MKTKQVIVMRKDLNMRKGKIAEDIDKLTGHLKLL
jgi:peptidyl-tRNA hydrolase